MAVRAAYNRAFLGEYPERVQSPDRLGGMLGCPPFGQAVGFIDCYQPGRVPQHWRFGGRGQELFWSGIENRNLSRRLGGREWFLAVFGCPWPGVLRGFPWLADAALGPTLKRGLVPIPGSIFVGAAERELEDQGFADAVGKFTKTSRPLRRS